MTTLLKLKTMQDSQIQEWLRLVGQAHVHTLVTALLGADEEVRNCVFRNMSKRAVAHLQDDLKRIQTMGVTESTINSAARELEGLI
jgi:flagellar motor switch protein FliG